jgi:hypothetical protein
METPAINNTIAFLMASNNEDIAADLANEVVALKLELERLRQEIMDRRERHQIKAIELERVKKIAANRLEVHAQRVSFVADRDANLARELVTRFPLGADLVNDAPKTRQIRDREREALDDMIAKNNEWLDAHGARTVIGEGGLWGAHCRGEI